MLEEEIEAFQETAHRAFLATLTSFTAYGIHVTIACACIYIILATKRHDPYSTFHVAFIGAVLALGTLNIALWSKMMIEGWKLMFLSADDKAFELLPVSFIIYGAANATASLIVTALCDGLLLYRCCIIWERHIYVAILPALLYLAAVGLGISDVAIFWSFRQHNGLKPYPPIYRLTSAYWFTLLSLNVLLTLLIVARIIYLQRFSSFRSTTTQRSSTTGQRSTSGNGRFGVIISLLAESSLLYSLAVIVGLAFNWWFFKAKVLPPQAVPLMIAYEVSPFNPYLTHLECIASELIILRVAIGRAWNKSRREELSTTDPDSLHFRVPNRPNSTAAIEASIVDIRHSRPSSRNSIPLGALHLDGVKEDDHADDDREEWSLASKKGRRIE